MCCGSDDRARGGATPQADERIPPAVAVAFQSDSQNLLLRKHLLAFSESQHNSFVADSKHLAVNCSRSGSDPHVGSGCQPLDSIPIGGIRLRESGRRRRNYREVQKQGL
jgi:hypothetical protein